MKKVDYKKDFKDLYLPKEKPMIIDVPEIIYFMYDGKGDPNTSVEYKEAMQALYGLTFTIKMSHLSKVKLEGYYEYSVFPLEGFWDGELFKDGKPTDKNKFIWTSMIRQPEFVTEDIFNWAKETLSKKKEIDLSKVRYVKMEEGLCVQIMHIGSYDDEARSIDKLHEFIDNNGYSLDISNERKHHEIYLGDPRKAKPENLKTVIRLPIKKL